jgi:hypothetical protein
VLGIIRDKGQAPAEPVLNLSKEATEVFLSRPKPSLFIEKIYDLNRGFAVTLAAFERLERLGMFRRNYLRAFRTMADELRARSNYELTETLRDREGLETAQFGRLPSTVFGFGKSVYGSH